MTPRVITETEEVHVEKQTPTKVVRTTTRVIPSQTALSPSNEYQTKKAIFRTYQVLFYILGLIELLLAFRLLLKLVGASTISGFTDFVYTLSAPFAAPFFGVVRASISGASVIEWSTLIAMAVYAVLVWVIVEFFQVVKPANPEEVEQVVDNT